MLNIVERCIFEPGVPVPWLISIALAAATGSSFADPSFERSVDADGDGYSLAAGDCDDGDAAVYPNAPETCDGLDDDCDPSTDENDDQDGDGAPACADCDDADPTVFPGAFDLCNGGIDDDCDPSTVEDADDDGDGFRICDLDCDDGDAAVYLGAPEKCNGVDDDCDPSTDENADPDGDGVPLCADVCPNGDDTADRDFDGVADRCDPCPSDGLDDSDLDGSCDSDDLCPDFDDAVDGDGDGVPDACDNCPSVRNWKQIDVDRDGFGAACECNDANNAAFPGATEVCDRVDNDCDGTIDVGAVDAPTGLLDEDGDGYGDQALAGCVPGFEATATSGDCDDADPDVSPGANERCNGMDDDCDGTVDEGCSKPESGGRGCATPVAPGGVAGWGMLGVGIATRRKPGRWTRAQV